MAANLDTTYLAVRDAIIAALRTALSATNDQVIVGEPEKLATSVPTAWLDSPEIVGRNQTAVSDEYTLTWTIRWVVARAANGKTDDTRIATHKAIAANLYAATNLGGYAYLAQIVDMGPSETNIEGGIAGGMTFTCAIEALRVPV